MIIWLGYFVVIFGHVIHTLLEAGQDFKALKLYIKSYPLPIIIGFLSSTLFYIFWMVEGLDLGENILVLPKGKPLLIWCFIIGLTSNILVTKLRDRFKDGSMMNIPFRKKETNKNEG